ncbi:hypothetical protein ABW20_dc0107483 [Dactylellina cionopaga]|nr:hypothetical protein ABW20_dc0107483 [Dactylellina cionopaga]
MANVYQMLQDAEIQNLQADQMDVDRNQIHTSALGIRAGESKRQKASSHISSVKHLDSEPSFVSGVEDKENSSSEYDPDDASDEDGNQTSDYDKTDRASLCEFIENNVDRTETKQILNCVLRLEDYLYEAKKRFGFAISKIEKLNAEDLSDDDSAPELVDTSRGSGLRATRTKSKNKSEMSSMIGTITYDHQGKRVLPSLTKIKNLVKKYFAISSKESFELPGDNCDTRDFTIRGKWTAEDLQRETTGKLPFIDPEVRMALELMKSKTEKENEDNLTYTKDIYYHPDDLAMISIETLPSNPGNGPEKPAHTGPRQCEEYCTYTRNLFTSIYTWIEKYIVPAGDSSININDPSLLPSIRNTVRKLEYFNESDFINPEDVNATPASAAERKIKRQIFFQYIFYAILNENIWKHWLYGLNKHVETQVLESTGLTRSQKNTAPGHTARGQWFTENIRRKETNMNIKVIDHQVQIATTLRQIFVPLLKFKDPGLGLDDRKMPPSAEMELQMIVGDAQALQLMFQSEYKVHMIQFDEPGTPFEKEWMVNGADEETMKYFRTQPAPGRGGILKQGDIIALSFQPALFVENETVVWERVLSL